MIQLFITILALAALSFVWTLISMKKDGYFDKQSFHEKEALKKKSQKRGSIIFFKDSVKHVK